MPVSPAVFFRKYIDKYKYIDLLISKKKGETMEKIKKQICTMLPHTCSAGTPEPRSVEKTETRPTETNAVVTNKEIKKPWSVFGDIYFL